MRKCLVTVILMIATTVFAQTKGLKVVAITDESGKEVGLYRGSYALLIGVSDYQIDWPDLESIPVEIDTVENILIQNGFIVTKVMNPQGNELVTAFQTFIDNHGYDKDNRLLFFYSGHGYSRMNGKKGYLVPVDAPSPVKDEKQFLQKSLEMSQIISWARQMETKHAIFLFDSCFSGTIFKTKALPKTPPHITAVTSRPVRQFITAGSAGEEVPAQSVFTPCFIRALKGDADLNNDHFITGTELGMYLNEKVLSYEIGQSPQYGKIRDPDLDEGDFVFQVQSAVIEGNQVETTTTSFPDSEKRIQHRKNAPILLQDDFSTSFSGPQSLFGQDFLNFEHREGWGCLSSRKQNVVLPIIYPSPRIDDFILEFEVRSMVNDPLSSFGLIFRSDEIQGGLDYYSYLRIFPQGNFVTMEVWKASWIFVGRRDLVHGSIPRGTTAYVELEVIGESITLSMNKKIVAEFQDSHLPAPGLIGFSISTTNPAEMVCFDNVILRGAGK